VQVVLERVGEREAGVTIMLESLGIVGAHE
jgi:hypothetical protein